MPFFSCRRRCQRPDALPPRCPPPPSCRRRIQRRRCAASAALALLTPSPHCPPLPRRCRAASAALPTLPPRIRRCRLAAATVAMLLPPPLLCRPVTLLPRCLPPQSCRHRRHRRRPCTAGSTTALPAIAAPLLHCLCHSADAATALQMPSPRCLLPPCCCRAASADAATTLPTPPLRC